MALDQSELDLIRGSVSKIAEEFDLEYWRKMDKTKEYPWAFKDALAEGGWLGILMPEEYGGMGLGLTECGIVLEGSEVKSLRQGGANIAESYAAVENGELWLVNAYIAPYEQAMFGHEERRRRKLLVSKKELARLWNETQRKGMTIVPLVLYFNHKGIAKMKVGIAKGKKNHDKRETEAKRDWNRQKQRLLKQG